MNRDNLKLQFESLHIANFRSIKAATISHLPPLGVVVGRNGAGKSNLFDAFVFLKHSAANYAQALQDRGGFKDLIFKKRSDSEIVLEIQWTVPEAERRALINQMRKDERSAGYEGISPAVADRFLNGNFLRAIRYRLQIGTLTIERLYVSDSSTSVEPTLLIAEFQRPTPHHGGGSFEGRTYKFADLDKVTLGDALPPLGAKLSHQGGDGQQLNIAGAGGSLGREIRLIADLIRSNLQGMCWVSPGRNSHATHALEPVSALNADASNLAGVLYTLSNNDEETFEIVREEMERLVPGTKRLFTPISQSTVTLAVEDEELRRVAYDFRYLSSGTRHALAIVTTVVTAPDGSLVLVEEPEAFLHPAAQALLLRFLRKASEEKTLLLSTQSALIAGSCSTDAVWLATKDKTHGTSLTSVAEAGIQSVIDELGIRASFNFEADVYVFVEGENDVPVYEAWATKFPFGRQVQFINATGWKSMHYFANAKVIKTSRIQRYVFVIFDGDTNDPEHQKAKRRLIEELGLPADHIFTLPRREAEAYLLDARSIISAYRTVTDAPEQLDEKIRKCSDSGIDPKEALRTIFHGYGLGRLDGEKAAAIADASTLPGDIEKIFSHIKAKSAML